MGEIITNDGHTKQHPAWPDKKVFWQQCLEDKMNYTVNIRGEGEYSRDGDIMEMWGTMEMGDMGRGGYSKGGEYNCNGNTVKRGLNQNGDTMERDNT